VRVIAAARVALLLASLPMFASAAGGGADASEQMRFSRAAYRCIKLAELISCGEALNMKPNDPGLLVAEADALVRMRRPGEAIGVYRNALTVAANPAAVNPKIILAQSQRRSLLDTCMAQEGGIAERACESAWLPGAPDEVALFKRRGSLLQAEAQLSAALDAYMAAARLRPGDRGAARAIVGLSGGTGRRDALTLTALGAAFVTLGHPSAAIAPLRQALRLSPDLTAAKERLRVAERGVAADADNAASLAGNPPGSASEADDTSIGPYTNEAQETRSN